MSPGDAMEPFPPPAWYSETLDPEDCCAEVEYAGATLHAEVHPVDDPFTDEPGPLWSLGAGVATERGDLRRQVSERVTVALPNAELARAVAWERLEALYRREAARDALAAAVVDRYGIYHHSAGGGLPHFAQCDACHCRAFDDTRESAIANITHTPDCLRELAQMAGGLA